MKLLLLLFLPLTLLFSNNIDLNNLLEKYNDSEELFLKTKKESAGLVIVYSRADLDKMQAYTLNDILKTIRMYTMQPTRSGLSTIVKSGADQMSGNQLKIYINSHELNSVTLGNSLIEYGKMSLYFIDHIEVYQASNPVTFGNEPGNTIIKLYTKEPSRENGTSAQLSIDSKSGSTLRAMSANTFGKYSYLISADINRNRFDTYKKNNYELSRDGTRGEFFTKFSKKESYDIELSAIKEDTDSFNGLGEAPTGGNIKVKNGYLHATKYFGSDTKISFSLSGEALDFKSVDADGITLADGTVTNSVESDIYTITYDAMIDHKYIKGANGLYVGFQYKQKQFTMNSFKSNDIEKSIDVGPKKVDIYMAYIEDRYNINQDNLITLSAKLDYYKNDFDKSSTLNIVRFGYVHLCTDKLTFKIIAKHGYTYPSFRQTTFSPRFVINPDLKNSISHILTAEATYKTVSTKLTFSIGGAEVEDAIVFNQTLNKYVNNDDTTRFQRLFIRAEHKLDRNNKVNLEYFKMFKDNYFSPGNGAMVQLFNKFKSFDIYNELIYRSKYSNIDGTKIEAGYNYSLGIIYPVNKQLDLKVKGENILDQASKTPLNDFKIPSQEKRMILTMEYVF